MIKLDVLIDAIHDAVVSANESLMDKHIGLIDKYFFKREGEDALEARTVILKYPQTTESGVKMIDVKVPLITLVPVSGSEIEELKFALDLNILQVGDNLEVSFGEMPDTKRRKDENKSSSVAHLEMTIKPTKTTEGLKKLIEGYERALRAQIPG